MNALKSLFEIFLSDAQTRKKRAKKRSLHGVNEHFELVFDEVSASTRDLEQALSTADPTPIFSANHRIKYKILLICLNNSRSLDRQYAGKC